MSRRRVGPGRGRARLSLGALVAAVSAIIERHFSCAHESTATVTGVRVDALTAVGASCLCFQTFMMFVALGV
jgi:hypothetical protein